MRARVAVAAVILVCSTCLADEPKAPPKDTPRTAEIKALIERLGSADFKQREAARERLAKIGDDAVPLLERAAKDPDAERAAAANEVLATMRWKLPKGLEELIGKPLEDYPNLPIEQRKLGLEKVAQNMGSAKSLAPFLSNVARFDPDPELRLLGLRLYVALTPGGDRARDELILESLDAEVPRAALHFPRAVVLQRLGNVERAVVEARKAMAAGDAEAGLFLSDLLVATGKPQEALALLEDVAKKNPADLEIQVRLGEAYLLTGEKQKGEELLASILKQKVADPRLQKDLLLRIARAWIRVKRPDDAREVMRTAVARAPYDHGVNVALAELDLALGHPETALPRLVNEARYCRRDSDELKRVREDLTSVFTKTGYPEVATDDDLYEDARRGRKLAPARERAGRYALARGLVEEAVGFYRAAAALDPESVESRVRLGDTLRRLGLNDEAKRAYDQARAIAPRDDRVGERLRSLALGTSIDGHSPAIEHKGDIAAWTFRLARKDLEHEPESPFASAPSPLVIGGRVVCVPAGTRTLVALDAKTGALAWKAPVPAPAPPEEVSADRVGIEPVALLAVPAAACAHLDPKRAREREPLIALVVNEWVRAPGRSWRKVSFEGALLVLVDPKSGRVIGSSPFLDEPVSSDAPPAVRGTRALVVTQPADAPANLALVDVVARKARWKQQLSGGASAPPLFVGDKVVAAFASGVAVFEADGSLAFAPLEGQAPTTTVTAEGDSIWFGSGSELRRADVNAKTAATVAKLPEDEVLAGSVAVLGSRVFVASRGGPVRAFSTSEGRELAKLPLDGADRAAARALVVVNGRVFALNGSLDSFKDELPSLLALDPATLAVLWRRPVDRPAALGTGEGMAVAVAGGVSSAAGLRVVGARPGAAAVDVRPRLIAEVRAAAEDALAEEEAEVAVLLTRRYVALKGGLSLVADDDLVFFARVLAKSRRPDDADAILGVARARDGSADAEKKIEAIRKDLGLVKEPEPEEPPKREEEQKPKAPPKDEKAPDKAPEAPK